MSIRWILHRSRGLLPRNNQQMISPDSSRKEKRLVPVYEALEEGLNTPLDLTFVAFSELPPVERLRVIESLLRTGAGRSLLAKTAVLQDATVSPPITPLPDAGSKSKPRFSFSTSNK